MNVIFAKHDCCEKEYCWEVPDEFKDYIVKGDFLLVNTIKGIDIATASTGIITGNGAIDVAEKSGAYFPLRKVISFVGAPMKNYICNKVRTAIAKDIQNGNINVFNDPDWPF